MSVHNESTPVGGVTALDLSFALQGDQIPLDHGYPLYGAITRVVPQVHGDRRVGIHPIRGVRRVPARLTLVPQSRLRLRIPGELIGDYLALVGQRLDLDGAPLTVGMPPRPGRPGGAVAAVRVEPLRPAAVLASRLVTLGQIQDAEAFGESLRRQLAGLGVAAEPVFLPSTDPLERGGPERRVLRIKGRRVVGYPVRLEGLTADESLTVQVAGLGSRRRMGCGLFVPAPAVPTDWRDDEPEHEPEA